MRRSRKWALGAAIAAGALVLALGITGWDQIQAWRLLLGDTVTIQPDPSLTGETVEENLRVIPALRSHVYRFQAKTLLRFLAARTGRPVVLRSSGRNALETWVDIDPRERRPITPDGVLNLLQSRGWTIVEQPFPKQAHVVLAPDDGPNPVAESEEDTDLTLYSVGDLFVKVRELEGTGARHSTDMDAREEQFTMEALRTFIEESTGGTAGWVEKLQMAADRGARTIIVRAPVSVHRDVQHVLDRLRASLSTDRG